MTGEDWARLELLFEDARQKPASERELWLEDHCADEAMRALVTDMLVAYDHDPEFLEASTDVAASVTTVLAGGLVGSRLGPYRVTAQVGRGGMGVVYDAVRDDGEFERRVAIKVLPTWSGVTLAERFRLERRVLASLDHPGIARLVDSGMTPDGAPYFVMEFIDGAPIDVWAREQRLDVRARVALVERVCDAVAYAHQHLIVHRDIKPANILVPADGHPKLLDFGIATLLAGPDGEDTGLTATGHQTFTVDFVSPEQIKGEAVTTASDVYSLGVLLYLLVAGRRPYTLKDLSPLEAMRTVCEVDPPPPSAVAASADAAAIRGDLDAVIGKALSKAPRHRYPTVGALAADLEAFRLGMPVKAAPESWARQARRFVRRNKAAAAVLVAIVVGGGVAAWQARVAATERDRAQRRFAQVREFSRSLIFDVNAALARVPGNTEPRRLVLDRAMSFLDGLAADTDLDDALAEELVEGYLRLGTVQGDGQGRNLGDARAAVTSFDKAAKIAERLIRARPADVDRISRRMDALDLLARACNEVGDEPAHAAAWASHLELVQRLERDHAGDPAAVARAAEGYSDAGIARADVRDLDAARGYYERSTALYASLTPAELAKGGRSSEYAFALKRLGAVLMVQQQLDESERRYRAALAIEEELLRRRPADADTEYGLTFTLSDLGGVLRSQGRVDEGEAMWRRALDIRKRAADADPKDVRALGGVATLEWRLANLARAQRRYREAVERLRGALAMRDGLLATRGPVPSAVAERSWVVLYLGEALLSWADADPASAESGDRRREAAELLGSLRPEAVTASVTPGSPPEFAASLAAMRRALAR